MKDTLAVGLRAHERSILCGSRRQGQQLVLLHQEQVQRLYISLVRKSEEKKKENARGLFKQNASNCKLCADIEGMKIN